MPECKLLSFFADSSTYSVPTSSLLIASKLRQMYIHTANNQSDKDRSNGRQAKNKERGAHERIQQKKTTRQRGPSKQQALQPGSRPAGERQTANIRRTSQTKKQTSKQASKQAKPPTAKKPKTESQPKRLASQQASKKTKDKVSLKNLGAAQLKHGQHATMQKVRLQNLLMHSPRFLSEAKTSKLQTFRSPLWPSFPT